MPHTALLTRLDAIAAAAAATGQALALLGLGSVGRATARLDAYSDLDFFLIARDGYKARFIDNLDWLNRPAPVVFAHRNTVDGYKLLYDDGIFAEMAVFESAELPRIPFADARIVWQAADFDPALATPARPAAPDHSPAYRVDEALTNLYVGLGRLLRGERASAHAFIQVYAVNHALHLLDADQPAAGGDPFDPTRRAEQRHPQAAALLPAFQPGYGHSVAAAAALLTFFEQRYAVNPALRAAVAARLDAARLDTAHLDGARARPSA